MGKLLYRIDEAASALAISVRQVYELLKEQKLTGHNPNGSKKKGLRVTAESIKDYAERHKIPAEPVGE